MMLKWPVIDLMRRKDDPLHFNETLDLKKTLMDRDPEIMDVAPVSAEGSVSFVDGDLLTTVTLKGKLVVPSTRSLQPVDLPLDFTFSEIYLGDDSHAERYEDGELLMPLDSETLDLEEAIADHLLLAIPMQILTPEEEASGNMPAGSDWEVLAEDDYQKHDEAEQQPNPAFAKLKEMFPDHPDKDDKKN